MCRNFLSIVDYLQDSTYTKLFIYIYIYIYYFDFFLKLRYLFTIITFIYLSIYLSLLEFFTSALADDLSLEFE